MPTYFAKKPKKGMPMSIKGLARALANMAHTLENLDIAGGYPSWDGFRLTLIPNGSNSNIPNIEDGENNGEIPVWDEPTEKWETQDPSGSISLEHDGDLKVSATPVSGSLKAEEGHDGRYWTNNTYTSITESGNFKTTGTVTVGGLEPSAAGKYIGAATPFDDVSADKFWGEHGYFEFTQNITGDDERVKFEGCSSDPSVSNDVVGFFSAYIDYSATDNDCDAIGPSAAYAWRSYRFTPGRTSEVLLSTPDYSVDAVSDINVRAGSSYYAAGEKVLDKANADVTTAYKIGGTKVVGAQGSAVANLAGGETDSDSVARAGVNEILAVLRAHGLIAT